MYLGPFPTVVACSHESVRELLQRPEFQGRVEGFIPQIRDDDGVIRGEYRAVRLCKKTQGSQRF